LQAQRSSSLGRDAKAPRACRRFIAGALKNDDRSQRFGSFPTTAQRSYSRALAQQRPAPCRGCAAERARLRNWLTNKTLRQVNRACRATRAIPRRAISRARASGAAGMPSRHDRSTNKAARTILATSARRCFSRVLRGRVRGVLCMHDRAARWREEPRAKHSFARGERAPQHARDKATEASSMRLRSQKNRCSSKN